MFLYLFTNIFPSLFVLHDIQIKMGMRYLKNILLAAIIILCSCSESQKNVVSEQKVDAFVAKEVTKNPEKKYKLIVEKDFLYDQHTLADTFPYENSFRVFQWDKIRQGLTLIDSIQREPNFWAVVQNRRNIHGEAPLTGSFYRNEYNLVADDYGVERYQSIPLYTLEDSITPVRYARDGSLISVSDAGDKFSTAKIVYFNDSWRIPSTYIKTIGSSDSIVFTNAIFVDRTNQNIATLEKVDSVWLVRSMNPATTGAHNPPYQHPTPLGIFVIQEKKPKMIYLVDGTTKTGGYAPYASRFSNGGYIHGVPVNTPHVDPIEFSSTLGTIPRSHMCVRNASSHAKFVYDWAPTLKTMVFIFD